MTIKLKESDFTNGISTIVLATELGEFVGTARLNPEDKASSFFGCELAELRAKLKYFKIKKKNAYIAWKTFSDFEYNLEQGKDYSVHSYEARKVRRRMYELGREYRELRTQVDMLDRYIRNLPTLREKNFAVQKETKQYRDEQLAKLKHLEELKNRLK